MARCSACWRRDERERRRGAEAPAAFPEQVSPPASGGFFGGGPSARSNSSCGVDKALGPIAAQKQYLRCLCSLIVRRSVDETFDRPGVMNTGRLGRNVADRGSTILL